MRRLACWLSILSWGWACWVALVDRARVARLDDVEPEPPGPDAARVTAIVPARDEEDRLGPALDTLAAQRHPLSVVVVDDRSSDGTLAEARGRASAQVRVLEGAPLPPGWVGKTWAIEQGVEAADGEWLLFTDADVHHGPEALGRALALARSLDVVGVTALCRLDSGTPVERVVQPAAAVLIRSFVAPGPIIRSPRWPHAIAIGAFILVRRDAYERAGGHRAIRDRLVDDRSLAELLKRAGTPLPVVDGTRHLRVRMYRSGGEVWRGWRKNASVGASDSSPWLALLAAAVGVVVALAPLWCLARGPRRLGALAALLQLGARLDVAAVAPTPRRYWATLPLGCLFLSAVTVASTLDRLRGGVVWRGRRYRV